MSSIENNSFEFDAESFTKIYDTLYEKCEEILGKEPQKRKKGKERKAVRWWEKFRILHKNIYVKARLDASKKMELAYNKLHNQDLENPIEESEVSTEVQKFENAMADIEQNPLTEFYKKIEPFFNEKIDEGGVELPDGELRNYFLDFVNRPKKYDNVYKMYNHNSKGFWSVSEFTDMLEQDKLDFPKLPKYVQIRMRYAIMFLSVGDGLINSQIRGQIKQRISDPISELLIQYVQYLESIHQIFYTSKYIVVTGNDQKKRHEFVKELTNNVSINKKINWAKRYLSPISPWVESFLCMAIQEGLGFQPQFNTILGLENAQENDHSLKLMLGLIYGTQLVIRDENTHQLNWAMYYYLMHFKPPVTIYHEMIREYVAIEDEYIDYIEKKCMQELDEEIMCEIETVDGTIDENMLNRQREKYINEIPPSMASLTPENQKKSVRYQANLLSDCLKYDRPYPEIERQPISSLENIGMTKTQKFFEVRANNYVDAKQQNFDQWVDQWADTTSLTPGEHEKKLLSLKKSITEQIPVPYKLDLSGLYIQTCPKECTNCAT